MKYKEGFQQLLAATIEFNTRNEASIRGLSGDIESLQQKIRDFEAIVTDLTPDEQAALAAVTAQASAVATSFEALDALTTAPVPSPTE